MCSSMDGRDALSRLTEREKVCLRQWLQHKSAKEIAADLGISHHAVEKRLKMARTKLDATSSLEAARKLGEAEGYGHPVAQSPDLASDPLRRHWASPHLAIFGVVIMSLIGALVLALLSQPTAFSRASDSPTTGAAAQVSAPAAVPAAGTEAALRSFVAGLASGSPDYAKLSPQFADIVRRDLPMTHNLFSSLGELKSMTFRGRGAMDDDIYDMVFANGAVRMSAALDSSGRILGGIFRPIAPASQPASTDGARPTPGTEVALRSLVTGLANGAPDYAKLSPQFADVVRRDLPMTHRMFSGLGELQSVTFRGRGALGDDAYDLVFANGGVMMSVALDAEGRMTGGLLQPMAAPAR